MPLQRNGARSSKSKVIRFQDEGRWLLKDSRADGPERAVAKLRSFLVRNESTYTHVMLFWGLHPPETITLADDDLTLGPLDALPTTDAQAFFLANPTDPNQLKPRAVLAQSTRIPIYEPLGSAGPEFTYEDKHFPEELMQVLHLATGQPLIRVAEWSQWPEDEPIVGGGGGYGYTGSARATSELPKTHLDSETVRALVERFIALDLVDRNRLRLPLRRLNASTISESLSDQAIEVGVALESLLSQPKDPHDGIGHRLQVRAGLLLGRDLASRGVIKDRVKRIYTLRSIAAHGADLDEVKRERDPWGVEGPFRKPEFIVETLNDARALVRDIATCILALGGYPDYSALELTATPDVHYGTPWEPENPE
jgi:hypothetical protein